MTIEKDFPFDVCETCCECVLNVEKKVLFANGDICQTVITVSCKNKELCKRLRGLHDACET